MSEDDQRILTRASIAFSLVFGAVVGWIVYQGAARFLGWQIGLCVALIVGVAASIGNLLTHIVAGYLTSGTSPFKFSLWCVIAIITGASCVKGMAIVLGQFGGVCFGIAVSVLLIFLGIHGPRHRETKKVKLLVSRIIDGYKKGVHTIHEASDRIMECISPDNVDAVLSTLSDELLSGLKSSVEAAPTTDQEWEEAGRSHSTSGGTLLKDEPPILPDDPEQSQRDEWKRLHRIRVEVIREHLSKYRTA